MIEQLVWNPILQFSVLVLTTISIRVALGRNPTIRFIVSVSFFALLTATLLSHDIVPYSPSLGDPLFSRRITTGLLKAVWWIGGAVVLVSAVRLFLIFENNPREGRLAQDLIVGIIYLGAGLALIANVFSLPVGTLIATSGAFAIVLGLALQSTLNDVFSGIALNLGRPYTVGDWIVLEGGLQGRVVETNWRSTHLVNGTDDLVVLPNSTLAKARLVNLTRPQQTHGVSITVRFLPTRNPAAIEETMRTVLLSSFAILKTPPPTALVVGIDSQAVEIELSFRISGFSGAAAAKSEIYDLIYRHARANGLKFAGPREAFVLPAEVSSEAQTAKHPGTPWRLLESIPLFATLTDDEKDALASSMTRRTYQKGSTIASKGSKLTSLMIMRTGVAARQRMEGGHLVDLARLSPGDLFGERGVLIDAAESGDTTALTFVVIYEVKKEDLAAVMRDRPALAEELGILLSRRMQEEEQLSNASALSHGTHPDTLATRIRRLFEIPRELELP
ncbi:MULTISPECIES: mechanosensitive ion channel family protein [unclassified Rhizobium]|uniref:mechanosensitive ion channel family protein n=1 Tax=unclassified Rhizobium TaxID=2613769 RepID=UPI001AD9C6C5|nr:MULTISPECIES: mechanosensitive ion channel family protein [unclassified Rhizobium]MBO9127978.1 mechanosensitive ion channel family protein [Rhizobium sp. 16-488-2b]MBO9178555.1 mechanosensitive ion channel family protein [Rhizobium sp. 16-488-2a]